MKTCVQLNDYLLGALLFVVIVRPSDGAEPPQPVAVEPSTSMCRCIGQLAPIDLKIEKLLDQPLKSPGLVFREEPLENIVNLLRDEYEVPVLLDEPAIEDAGLTADEPVTINLKGISLRSALRLLLKQKDLTYILRNEMMLITTPETAESDLITCLYDVRDLKKAMPPPTPPAGASAWADYDSLIGALTECVSPRTWSENGGKGDVRSVHSGILVIYQTQQVHAEIAGLLDSIRQTLRRPVQSLSNVDGMQIAESPADPSARGAIGAGGGGVLGPLDPRGGFSRGYDGRGNQSEREPTPTPDNPFN